MLTILIIEDNMDEMTYCESAIQYILKESNILKAESAEMALHLLSENKIDIFFIDVDLPGMSGFQLAEEIRKKLEYLMTTIVFLTGHRANHLEIHHKYHHYEYIEKPYSLENFLQRVGPMLIALDLHHKNDKELHVSKKKKMILLETNKETLFIDLDEILFVETERRKLNVHTKQKVVTGISGNIAHFINEVNNPLFLQCHKSYAINISNIITIKKFNRRLWSVFFHEHDRNCFISQTYYETIYQKYLELMKEKV